MKNKKERSFKKQLLLIGLYLIIGAFIGGSISMLDSYANGQEVLRNMFNNTSRFFVNNFVFIQLLFVVILFIPGLIVFLTTKSKYNKIDQDSEDADLEIDKVEERLNLYLTFSITGTIVHFILMALIMTMFYSNSNDELIINNIVQFGIAMLIFLCITVLNQIFDIRTMRLMKKIYPYLDAEPTSFKYEDRLENSFDEAQRYIAYRASYKTFVNLKLIFIVLWLVCIFLHIISPSTYIVIGVIWLYHSLSYIYYANKFGKSNKEIYR